MPGTPPYVNPPEIQPSREAMLGPPGLPRGIDEGQLRGRRRQRGADQVARAGPGVGTGSHGGHGEVT